ncbi:hypothetical protein F5X99DRAFT_386933 [Biscogniauxia marginata]|nr:hypothetical protein F5X99DRAFT_386933 [Biscogniauxia marginata]
MGSKASKPVQTATRKFPSRSPGGAVPPRPPPRTSFAKDDAIKADGLDPDTDTDPLTNPAFSQRLRQMGVATPNPTLSRSSTAAAPGPGSPGSPARHQRAPGGYPAPSQNRTLSALEARERLQRQAQAEFEDPTRGREFLDVGTLRQILVMRAQGGAPADIEKRLRLKSGVVGRLGPQGIVLPVASPVTSG